MSDLKQAVQEVQNSIVKSMQLASRITMPASCSDEKMNELMDNFLCSIESACMEARTVIERYRPVIPMGDIGKKPTDISGVTGSIEVTMEGWLHITLNTLLPHCKFKTSGYLQDTLTRLMDSYEYELPRYEQVFMAIVEYCDHDNRNAFDNDNKGWKVIPNAMKGRLFTDDDQFHLSIGLFAQISHETACHIYVLPLEDTQNFVCTLLENLS